MRQNLRDKIIDVYVDTMEFYLNNPERKSIDHRGACAYRGQCDNMCAVGRYIPNNLYTEDIEGLPSNHQNVIACLPRGYKDKRMIKLFRFLQDFHDKRLKYLHRFSGNRRLKHLEFINGNFEMLSKEIQVKFPKIEFKNDKYILV